MPAYFDTNVIRYVGQGLTAQLPLELRRKVAVSAVSAIELVSQIAVDPVQALAAIHTFENWLDTDGALLLDWSEAFVASRVFGLPEDDQTFELLQQVLRVCFRTDAPSPKLIEDAQRLRTFNEDAKRQKALLFEGAILGLRASRLTGAALRPALSALLIGGLRAKYGQGREAYRSDGEIQLALSAHIELHEDLIERAVREAGFNFLSRDHLNDLFDVEQLVYLAGPDFNFYTADNGYRAVRHSGQRARIHIVDVEDVRDPAQAFRFLSAELQRLAR